MKDGNTAMVPKVWDLEESGNHNYGQRKAQNKKLC